MGALKDIGSSITGSIGKAMLCVKKVPISDVFRINVSNIDLRAMLASSSTGLTGALPSFAVAKGITAVAGYHIMQVKYNPSTIKFSVKAENTMRPGIGGAGANQVSQAVGPAKTMMTVSLVFDDVSVPDAFMSDKFTPSTGGAVSAAAGIAKNLLGDGYTIQKYVDGLVALITQSETRQVVFFWSEQAFAGEVVGINATYTMFSPSGKPIRGIVELTICQSESETTGKGDEAYWNKAFSKLFDSSNEGLADDSKVSDSIGNLLNF